MPKNKIVHLISDLEQHGGAQNVLCSLLPYLNINHQHIYTLADPSGSLHEDLASRGIKARRLTLLVLFKLIVESYLSSNCFIHCHLTLPFYLSLFFNYRRVIFTEHSNTNKRRHNFFFSRIDRYFVYPRFFRIVAVSQGVVNSLRAYLSPFDPTITILPNTISDSFLINPTEVQSLIESRHKHLHKPVIVMTARFSYHKYQLQLLELLALCDNFRLILIGDGPLLPSIISASRQLKVYERCQFTGALSRKEIIDVLKMSTFYIHSSHTESFGIAALEAMSLGLPTFVSSIPGLAEISSDPFFLFPNHDLKLLRNRLFKLCSNSTFYSELSSRCYVHSCNYRPKVISVLVDDFYSRLSDASP